MDAEQRHRGPDASGVYANGPAVLSHQRLSILDLSDDGNQPMENRDGSIHVVFNGEIYNYKELKDNLESYAFRSETDTEVLLHLYEKHGKSCLQHLRGMFAFAIWDEREERLFFARDRLGQKPLYYHHSGDGIVFASTIKAILADPDIRAVPDYEAIREYLTYQYVPPPRTGFEDIYQLKPAEYAVFEKNGLETETYWSVSFANQSDQPESTLVNQLRENLKEATRLRMRSDVPYGVFLSGGLDSSIVTALMSEESDDTLDTYSIGFEEAPYNELRFARQVADHFDTNHHEFIVTPDLVDVLPKLVDHYEMPFGDSSALPTYYLSKMVADDVKVAIGGDAGDENFAGYNRYTLDWIATNMASIPTPVLSTLSRSFSLLPASLRHCDLIKYPTAAVEVARKDDVDRYAWFKSHFFGEELRTMWEGPSQEYDFAYLREVFSHSDGPTRLDNLLQVDLQTYLPNDLLVKVDRASMAHSLEVRSPFLDHKLVQFCARIPAKYKWRRGDKKWLLKRAFRNDLPDEVVNRKKQGFGIPMDEWFRGELRGLANEALDQLGTRSQFNRKTIDTLFSEHQSGRDVGHRIWILVMLELWFERFID